MPLSEYVQTVDEYRLRKTYFPCTSCDSMLHYILISCKPGILLRSLNWHGWRESQRALSPLVRALQTAPVGRHHGGNRACRLPVWATQESRLTSLCVRHQLLIWLYSSCFVGPNFVIVNAVNGQTSKNGAAACHPPRILKGCSHHGNLHVAGADRDPASKLREINGRRCRVSESILQFAMQNDKADMQRQKQEVHIGAYLCYECTFTLCAYSVFPISFMHGREVPDERLETLANLAKSQKIIHEVTTPSASRMIFTAVVVKGEAMRPKGMSKLNIDATVVQVRYKTLSNNDFEIQG